MSKCQNCHADINDRNPCIECAMLSAQLPRPLSNHPFGTIAEDSIMCNLQGCKQKHATHHCQGCNNNNSNHFWNFCPSNPKIISPKLD